MNPPERYRKALIYLSDTLARLRRPPSDLLSLFWMDFSQMPAITPLPYPCPASFASK
jgi:hypothetical protein